MIGIHSLGTIVPADLMGRKVSTPSIELVESNQQQDGLVARERQRQPPRRRNELQRDSTWLLPGAFGCGVQLLINHLLQVGQIAQEPRRRHATGSSPPLHPDAELWPFVPQ